MKKSLSFALFVIVFCVAVNNVYSDDSIVAERGRSAYPIDTDKIRMMSEKVKIYSVNQEDISITCQFAFENISNKKVKAKVGFPGTTMEKRTLNVFGQLRDFSAEVNGHSVPVDRKLEVLKTLVDKNGNIYSEKARYWYTWEVEFSPHEKVILKNSYDTRYFGPWWEQYLEYVLTTGANWSGPIGEAYIEVEYDDYELMKGSILKIEPEGYEIKGNKIIWHFKDFTPRENIRITEFPGGRYNDVAAYSALEDFLTPWRKNHPYDGDKRLYTERDLDLLQYTGPEISKMFSLRGLLLSKKEYVEINELNKYFAFYLSNEIFARHGMRLETKYFDNFFRGYTWYAPNQVLAENRLNDIERKNIQLINEWMKRNGWDKEDPDKW